MRRELSATVGSTDIDVVVEREDDRWRVVIGDRERLIDAAQIRPGVWSLLIDGVSHVVHLSENAPDAHVAVDNTETWVVLEDARRKRLSRAAGRGASRQTGETLCAPIAGRVVKIVVAVGDVVEPGQLVAILEAMKMENEIKASRGGTVAHVHTQAGQSVETREKLVTLA